MSSILRSRIGLALLLLMLLTGSVPSGYGCTIAVVSGRVTADGRPLMWKNRDYGSAPRNEVAILSGGKYRALAVVNAGSRSSAWMGVNTAGFCIINSLSRDLASETSSEGPRNGAFIKLALKTCASVGDFEDLLDATNETGRRTVANFGVIDAQGGAAIFETGPSSYVMFDANDREAAPSGFVVRSNFATTAQDLPADPTAEQLVGIPSGARFLRARSLLQNENSAGITLEFLVQNLSRDLADENGHALPGTINNPEGPLPPVIQAAETISRTTTVSAAIFQGVRPGEDPATTAMWTILGDPKFSIAVPCWAGMPGVADPLLGEQGGEIGELARALRSRCLTTDREGVHTHALPGIWSDLLPLESRFLADCRESRVKWESAGVTSQELAELHNDCALKALAAMHQETLEAEAVALRGSTH